MTKNDSTHVDALYMHPNTSIKYETLVNIVTSVCMYAGLMAEV